MSVTRTAAVFLDRDGVLNAVALRGTTPHPPEDIEDLEILPGAEEACRTLHDAGYLLVCVSNQPDVARGLVDRAAVDAIGESLRVRLGLDAVLVCPHDDEDKCECRKPLPGMLLDAAQRLSIELGESVMVGDRWKDIEAGRAAGCTTVFVDHGYGERAPHLPDHIAHSLADAVPWILGVRAKYSHGASR